MSPRPAVLLALALAVSTVSGGCSSPAGGVPGGDAGADAPIGCPLYSPPAACPDPSPSYSSDVAPILQERCSLCHFPGGIEASQWNLSTYDGVVNAGTAIVNALDECAMPPTHGIPDAGVLPAPDLTAAQRATLLDWIVPCQAPNN